MHSYWISVKPEGLYIKPAGVYVDPIKPVEKAIITRAAEITDIIFLMCSPFC